MISKLYIEVKKITRLGILVISSSALLISFAGCGDSRDKNEHLGTLPSIADETEQKLQDDNLTEKETEKIRQEGEQKLKKALDKFSPGLSIPFEQTGNKEVFRVDKVTATGVSDCFTLRLNYKMTALKDLPEDWYTFEVRSVDDKGDKIHSNFGGAFRDDPHSYEKGETVKFKGKMTILDHRNFEKLTIELE